MKTDPFATPLLFLIFNRPDTTIKVFQRLREIRPAQLYVSADGPRLHKHGEEQKCNETRRIIDQIDWPCDLKTNYSNTNLGCRKAVSSGIDWFFNNVEEGIILEDDCLPYISFFHFCETLLAYYRDNKRIMHIGGTNYQDGKTYGTGSYYFSAFNHIWGWATWKRAWNFYDVDMKSYPECLRERSFDRLFADPAIRNYWINNFDLVFKNKKDTWDFQWQYATTINQGLAIIPNNNLVTNIGFDANATHTVDKSHSLANRPAKEIREIIHPSSIYLEQRADRYTFRRYFSPPRWKKAWTVIKRTFQ